MRREERVTVQGPAKKQQLRGGVEVRNLPQFTAVLPQFFSDASIQNFQFSPEEKSFSLFAVTRHTVRFYVLICPTYHLCGRTLFCFCVPKMSFSSWDSDSGKGKRPVKRGKGQFFSFCKYTDTDQRHSMSDNARRVAFMAHYNGDVEGRLDC